MLGLSAYFDESGHSEDARCRFVGMGGLIAPESAWTEFEKKWQAVLDEQCEGHWFHMKDYAPGYGIYEGWGKKRREKLFGALVKAVRESGAKPFGAVVSLDAYEIVCSAFPGIEKWLGDPYYICFRDVTLAAAVSVISYSMHATTTVEEWQEFEKTEKVAMVYARHDGFGTISSSSGTRPENMGRAESIWYDLRTNPAWGHWMGAYSSNLPQNLVFLQAADLFAYELTHEFENRVNRPQDPMRWGLAQMLPGSWRDFLHKFYGVPQLLNMLVECRILGPHEDPRHGLSINTSMSNIMHRDLLFGRMYERRNKDKPGN
ncbi:MAG TPA: hypothetical protein VK819_04530 [Acidobacteriaceae bacterium]|jgi:hypothetical protein|nr:hypothetical protein [Acidobacteriaceae bacterium]